MNNFKILITTILLVANSALADNTSKNLTFDDANGNRITCNVDSKGEPLCKNSNKENVICANTDNGYTCSSN